MATESPESPAQESIDLKDPALAAFLAWLVPGLGHWYQGRRAKAALYFICILGLFSYGVYLGGNNTLGYGRAVYFSLRSGDVRLLYGFQIGVGLPALPALVQANRMNNGQKVWLNGFMAPPWPSEQARKAASKAARDAAGRAGLPDGDDPNIGQPTAGDLHFELHHYFELAGFYTMVAGLLNVLAIYDAFAGPVVIQPVVKKEEPEKEVESG